MGYFSKVNPREPYVFVSYANADRTQVFADVLRLQNAGVNLWIDEDLKRYTGASWKKAVQSYMRNGNCKAILFFTSKFSLASDAVRFELDQSCSEEVKGTHFWKALPIVPMMVNKIERITEFCDQLANDCSMDDWESELSDDAAYVPSRNVSYLRNKFFPSDDILYGRIYDVEDITFLLEALNRLGMRIALPYTEDMKIKAKAGELYRKGMYYYNEKRMDKALDCWNEAAIYGKRDVYYAIGCACWGERQEMQVIESKKIESCFLRAAEQGGAKSIWTLGMFYAARRDKLNAERRLTELKRLGKGQKGEEIGKMCAKLEARIQEIEQP